MHVWALHIARVRTIPLGIEPKSEKDTLPFHPYYTVKDIFGLAVFLLVYAFFIFYYPNYLGHTDNYIPADPMVTPAHIVPEWYFLPFYAILRAIPSKLGGVIAMFGSIALLAFLPWLDTSRVRSAVYRPLFKIFFWVFVAVTIVLGYLGSQPPEGGAVIAARILTVYYFAHLLVILPLLGLFETPRKIPASIADAVLGGHGGSGGSGASVAASAASAPNTKG